MGAIRQNIELGQKGGKVKSNRKTLSARQNARLRWHGKKQDGVIPMAALIDGAWYLGKGRSASVAVWDAHHKSFHTVGINSYRDPLDFPKISQRVARLKQETHIETSGGSFAPQQILATE